MAAKLVSIGEAPFIDVCYVTQHMREADAAEVHARRWDSDADSLAAEVTTAWGRFGWVVYNDDEPIAILGATQLWPGVWSAWMVATDSFPKVGLFVTRFVRKRMIPLLREDGAHRCDALSAIGHRWAHKWLEKLGARKETVLKDYGKNREDFIVYRWHR